MDFASFNLSGAGHVIALAVHDGHELRPDLAGRIGPSESTRLREEDPHTGLVASMFEPNVVVHRSRFEVDLNRPREKSVYLDPADSWDMDVWPRQLGREQIEASLALYDDFYDRLGSVLDAQVKEEGGFVLYDIHSYNHRRQGPDEPPGSAAENPTLNLGTGSLPERWKTVADAFVETTRAHGFNDGPLDVRENVRFRGGHLAEWVHQHYGEVGCALAIELKKVFMDEWSGELYPYRLAELGDALVASAGPVRKAWAGA